MQSLLEKGDSNPVESIRGGGGQAGASHPNPPGDQAAPGRSTGPPSTGHNGVREERGKRAPGTALQRPLQGPEEGPQGLPHRGGGGGADSHSGPTETTHRGGGGGTSGTATERPPGGRPSGPGGTSSTTRPSDTRNVRSPAEGEGDVAGTSGYH